MTKCSFGLPCLAKAQNGLCKCTSQSESLLGTLGAVKGYTFLPGDRYHTQQERRVHRLLCVIPIHTCLYPLFLTTWSMYNIKCCWWPFHGKNMRIMSNQQKSANWSWWSYTCLCWSLCGMHGINS